MFGPWVSSTQKSTLQTYFSEQIQANKHIDDIYDKKHSTVNPSQQNKDKKVFIPKNIKNKRKSFSIKTKITTPQKVVSKIAATWSCKASNKSNFVQKQCNPKSDNIFIQRSQIEISGNSKTKTMNRLLFLPNTIKYENNPIKKQSANIFIGKSLRNKQYISNKLETMRNSHKLQYLLSYRQYYSVTHPSNQVNNQKYKI